MQVQSASTNNTVYNNILYNPNTTNTTTGSGTGAINISPDSRPGFRSDYNAVVDRFSPGKVSAR